MKWWYKFRLWRMNRKIEKYISYTAYIHTEKKFWTNFDPSYRIDNVVQMNKARNEYKTAHGL